MLSAPLWLLQTERMPLPKWPKLSVLNDPEPGHGIQEPDFTDEVIASRIQRGTENVQASNPAKQREPPERQEHSPLVKTKDTDSGNRTRTSAILNGF